MFPASSGLVIPHDHRHTAEDGGGDIVRMPFQGYRLHQDPLPVERIAGYGVGRDQAADNGGGAASQPPLQRDIIVQAQPPAGGFI